MTTEKMPDEYFKPVYGLEGIYEISISGTVRNIQKGNILYGFKHTRGYRCFLLSGKDKVISRSLHRMLVETFIGPIKKGYVVNHIDGDVSNNSLCNLEVVSQRENVCHGKAVKQYAGVTFFNGKWQSRITHNGKRIFLGYFSTQEDANDAYIKKLNELNLENKYAKKSS